MHAPQASQGASGCGQAARHAPQCVHEAVLTISCGRGESPSGLWHHWQRSGQPFMNTVVRTPGPS